jgi:glycosyltransferase involved in cell wall biosynthesis
MTSVSVVVPSHNRPERVLGSLESIRDQTKAVDEIILVDDRSEEDYSEVREKLDSLDEATMYVRTEGIGASAARNLGASKASGQILMFLDDDDRWGSEKVERQLERFDADHRLVYSGRKAVDDVGSTRYRIDGAATGDLSNRILITNLIGTTSSPAIDADLFESVSGFDPEMPALQDWELWIRLCQHTNVSYDPAHTVQWTVHSDGDQMTADYRPYEAAVGRIERKHAILFERLSTIERRRASAYRKRIVAGKRPASSPKRYCDLIRSLLLWPSLGAAAGLIPSPIVQRLRD